MMMLLLLSSLLLLVVAHLPIFSLQSSLLPYGVVVGRGSAAGNVFRLQPPMCIAEHDVNTVCDAIEDVARKFIKEKNL